MYKYINILVIIETDSKGVEYLLFFKREDGPFEYTLSMITLSMIILDKP